MLEASTIDHIILLIGQKEKAKANCPITKLKIKLCKKTVLEIRSSISTDHKICKINGNEMAMATSPFHMNNKLKACKTLNKKNAVMIVNRNVTVEAAR